MARQALDATGLAGVAADDSRAGSEWRTYNSISGSISAARTSANPRYFLSAVLLTAARLSSGFSIRAADFVIPPGRSRVELRIRLRSSTNNDSATTTVVTVDIRPRGALTGTLGSLICAFGAAVGATSITPVQATQNEVVGTPFALPADGDYEWVDTVSVADWPGGNPVTAITAELQYRYV